MGFFVGQIYQRYVLFGYPIHGEGIFICFASSLSLLILQNLCADEISYAMQLVLSCYGINSALNTSNYAIITEICDQ